MKKINKIDKIHINKIYTMAKSMKCDEFESLVAKLIDGVPFTSVHNNKYYLVNERVILEPTTGEGDNMYTPLDSKDEVKAYILMCEEYENTHNIQDRAGIFQALHFAWDKAMEQFASQSQPVSNPDELSMEESMFRLINKLDMIYSREDSELSLHTKMTKKDMIEVNRICGYYEKKKKEFIEQYAEHRSPNQSKGDFRKVIIDFLAWRNGSILSKDTFLEIDTFLKEIKEETK